MKLAKAFIFVAVGAVLAQTASAQYTAVRLHPTSGSSSMANAVSGGMAVGQLDGMGAVSNSGDSMQIMNDGGFFSSVANGIHDGTVVGTSGATAIYWPSTSSAAQPLPMGSYFGSTGYAVHGGDFVGAAVNENFFAEPVMWPAGGDPVALAFGQSGQATAIDANWIVGAVNGGAYAWTRSGLAGASLHDPIQWMQSEALGVSGQDIVGYVLDLGFSYRATLWSGPLHAPIDLHPAGFDYSFARATASGVQVGYGHQTGDFLERALLWTGSAESVVNLHDFLPAGEYVASFAYGIDADGNIVGGARTAGGETHAYMWKKAGYTVGPFLCPINDPAAPISEFKKKDLILLRTTVRDGNGAIAPGVNLQASVKRLSNGTMLPASQFSLTGTSRMIFIPFINEYWLILDMDWSKGLYEIGATVTPSGETHSVVIRIK